MDWISVKDRLPEKDGRYWVCQKETDLCERTCAFCNFSFGSWVAENYLDLSAEVIFWMPLPEPPKEEVVIWIRVWKSKEEVKQMMENGEFYKNDI